MDDQTAPSPAQAVTQAMPSTAQARIISAALELFAQNGVGGTSLQMIADAIGVTKAAVYHQYNTKDEIVLAAAKAELEGVDAVVRAAEAEPSRARARKTLVTGMVDLAVAHRRTVSSILNDPVIVRFFAEHESFRPVMDRMSRVLMDDDIGHEARVSTAMLTAAISGTVMHPLVAGLNDEVLRSQLQRLAERLLPAMNTKPKQSQRATRR
ncbi:MAG: helix-turn-helix domain-containing protein [Acidimicrobiales bacterium]|jgi:AcrR family transcriptional regulator